MVMVQKKPFFQLFFYTLQTRKMYSMIFQNEKMLVQAIKTRSSESRKIDIFPKRLTHGFGPKMANFSTFFVYAIQTRKMYPMIFKNLKKSKNGHFSKRVNPPKTAIFPTFFFTKIQSRKMSLMIVQNVKTPFQAIKTRSSESRQIDIFPKG